MPVILSPKFSPLGFAHSRSASHGKMEDGLKDLGLGDRARVRDIAEVAAEALR